MKYEVTYSYMKEGSAVIEVEANDYDSAWSKALKIVEEEPERIEWDRPKCTGGPFVREV